MPGVPFKVFQAQEQIEASSTWHTVVNRHCCTAALSHFWATLLFHCCIGSSYYIEVYFNWSGLTLLVALTVQMFSNSKAFIILIVAPNTWPLVGSKSFYSLNNTFKIACSLKKDRLAFFWQFWTICLQIQIMLMKQHLKNKLFRIIWLDV